MKDEWFSNMASSNVLIRTAIRKSRTIEYSSTRIIIRKSSTIRYAKYCRKCIQITTRAYSFQHNYSRHLKANYRSMTIAQWHTRTIACAGTVVDVGDLFGRAGLSEVLVDNEACAALILGWATTKIAPG